LDQSPHQLLALGFAFDIHKFERDVVFLHVGIGIIAAWTVIVIEQHDTFIQITNVVQYLHFEFLFLCKGGNRIIAVICILRPTFIVLKCQTYHDNGVFWGNVFCYGPFVPSKVDRIDFKGYFLPHQRIIDSFKNEITFGLLNDDLYRRFLRKSKVDIHPTK